MRACEQCGLSIGDAATFCPVCGTPAASPVSVVSAPPEPGAAQSGTSGDGQVVGQEDRASPGGGQAPSRRLDETLPPMMEARHSEKTDPARAAALYREAILGLLEAAADPLDREDVRHDLLAAFDRLSLVLKREGLPAEALEEVECAASLGLLECRDRGIKGHRDALRKRRASLHRALDGGSSPTHT
jgi:hypothetical protein